jgi:ABC-type phosphate transport system substrate-binding protein
MKSILLKIGLACGLLLAGRASAPALEGVVLIINPSVPVDSISAAALKDLYTGRTTYWPDGQSVKLAVLDDQVTAQTDAALQAASGMDASHFKTFWQRMVFSGRGQQPKQAADAAALVALVAATPGALAIVPADAGLKGVKIINVK